MTFNISNRDKFLNNFLIPLSKVADSAVIKIENGRASSLVATSDNTVVVSCTYKDSIIQASKTLNVPDLKKFCRVISCIEQDDFELDISSNFIGYKSENVRFKYHLYDDGIINSPKLNIDKLNTLEFDGKFTLPYASIINLVKGSSISTETNKLYISVKGNTLLGELTDKTRANIDSYGITISSDYEGTQFALPIPLNFEIFRIISSMRFKELQSRVLTKMGVITMDVNLEDAELRFVISALAN
jgi:hypothetical protein